MRRFERMIALGAVPLMVITEVCMASSLLLPNAAQLAGRWQLYSDHQPAQACALRLGASAGELNGDLACAERLLGLRPGSWLVTPDTLALVAADGSQAMHFSRQGAGYYGLTTANGTHLVLERQDK